MTHQTLYIKDVRSVVLILTKRQNKTCSASSGISNLSFWFNKPFMRIIMPPVTAVLVGLVSEGALFTHTTSSVYIQRN